jgi:hypothetical protein
MKAQFMIVLMGLLLISCGGENKGETNPNGVVGGTDFQAAIATCSKGRVVNYSELDNFIYSRVNEFGRVYRGLSKSVVETFSASVYFQGRPVSCLLQRVKNMTVINNDSMIIYSLVDERVESTDSKIECRSLASSKRYILKERRDPLNIFSKIPFDYRTSVIRMDVIGNTASVCIDNGSGSNGQFVTTLSGSMWNSPSLLVENFFDLNSGANQQRRIQVTRTNDTNIGQINIYNYPIILD